MALSVSSGKYLPSWFVHSGTSHSDGFIKSLAKYFQVVLSTVPSILPALSVSQGKYLHVFLSTVLPAIFMGLSHVFLSTALPAIFMALSVSPGKYLQVVYDLFHSEFVMHACNH
jgi:hypothetical protein